MQRKMLSLFRSNNRNNKIAREKDEKVEGLGREREIEREREEKTET